MTEQADASRIRTDVGYIDPKHLDRVDTHIRPEDVQTEFGEVVYPENDVRVLGTTYRAPNNKSMLTKATRKVGKMLGVVPRNTTYKSLDFDLDLLKGTCLENITLTDLDISVLKPTIEMYMQNFRDNPIETRDRIINENIPIYCEFRNLMTNRDPYFLDKYPNISSNFLSSALSSAPRTLTNYLSNTLNMSDRELKNLNSSIDIIPRIEGFTNLMNRTFYTEGQGSQYLGKHGGKRRTRRNKRSRHRRSRRRYKRSRKI